MHFWGYQEDMNHGGLPAGALPQYPGPTLIVNQNDTVTITLTSELPFGQCDLDRVSRARRDGKRRQPSTV